MRVACSFFFALGLLRQGLCQRAQELATAIANYSDLSTFRSALESSPSLFDSILSKNSSQNITVLIPTNEAFAKFSDDQHQPVTALPPANLTIIMQYHVIDAGMTSTTLNSPRGVTAPTLLKDSQYNNRSAGADLITDYGSGAATGQVLFISADPINPVQLRVRQSTSVNLRGGLAQTAVMKVVDGQWPGGYFQTIDSVLVPPMPCSNTIRSQESTLSSLDKALNTTNLYPTLNTSPNVTCLAPSDNAFKAAGNPETQLNTSDLASALLFHTLPMPIYSNYITDGMAVTSVGGPEVKIRLINGEIYFNDAKVVSPNVITNNGIIHVLDKVMSPNGTAPAATATATATSSQTAVATGSASASASASSGQALNPGIVGLTTPAEAIGRLVAFTAIVALLL